MVRRAKGFFFHALTAISRIVMIFLILSMGIDAMTRIYYSYMPVDTWMDFQSVEVKMIDGVAVAVIVRNPHQQSISVFHRTLLIRYPDERRGCTSSTVTIIDDPTISTVVVPMSRMLDEHCPDIMGPGTIDGVLQVSYIFEFPYGVKRLAIRYSNRFSLSYNGKYEVGPPIHLLGLSH